MVRKYHSFKKTNSANKRKKTSSLQIYAKKKTYKDNKHSSISLKKKKFSTKLYRAVLVGKPNVGKSSLFNILTRTNSAIITKVSGTTRDSINRVMKKGEKAIMLSDLPGWDKNIFQETIKSSNSKIYQTYKENNIINPTILNFLRKEINASDIIIAVIDINDITAEDKIVLELIHSYNRSSVKSYKKPIIYCANKSDNKTAELAIGEVYEMGGEDVVPVSAKVKRGLVDLEDAIFCKQSELINKGIPSVNPYSFFTTSDYKIAIVGKPNSGKSSLLNAFLNKERAVVSEVAGTTRDLVEDFITVGKHTVKLIDTGGLRRKTKKKSLPENFLVQKAVHAITQSDIVILLIDAVEGISDQDKKIAALAFGKKKSLVIALNKWDLITEKWETYYGDLLLTYPSIKEFPILPISSANRKNLLKLLKVVDSLYERRSCKVTSEELSRSLRSAGDRKSLAGAGSHGGAIIRYAMQVQNHPPVFYIYVSNLSRVKNNFRQYLYNHLENLYNLKGTPLTIRFFEHKRSTFKK